MTSRRMREPDWTEYKDKIISMRNKRYPETKILRYLYKKKRFFPSHRQLQTALKRWQAEGLVQHRESDGSAEDFNDNSNQSQTPTPLGSQRAIQDQGALPSTGDDTTGVNQPFHDNHSYTATTSTQYQGLNHSYAQSLPNEVNNSIIIPQPGLGTNPVDEAFLQSTGDGEWAQKTGYGLHEQSTGDNMFSSYESRYD